MMCEPRTVLIVDDEPFILTATARLLESNGHTVHTCDDWTRVAAVVRHEQPHVVLLDYNMPNVKGDDLCAILKRNMASEMQVVLFSSEPEIDLMRITAQCGADGYIKKDVPAPQLLERISRVLSTPAA